MLTDNEHCTHSHVVKAHSSDFVSDHKLSTSSNLVFVIQKQLVQRTDMWASWEHAGCFRRNSKYFRRL